MYINKTYYNYLEYGKYTLYKIGRKKKNMYNNIKKLIISIRNNYPLYRKLP